jgi:CRP-like cAMP-binding protein
MPEEMHLEQKLGGIDPVALFQELLFSQGDSLKSDLEEVHLEQGEFLFRRGDQGDALYILESGQLQIFTMDLNGCEMTLNTLSSGELVGELALLDERPRSASARAVENCTLYRLKRDCFVKLIYQSSSLDEYLIRLLSARVRYNTEYVELLGHWSRLIIEGKYDEVLDNVDRQTHPNEKFTSDRVLAAVSASVGEMVKVVKQREDALRQQVKQLSIEIDQEKLRNEVSHIVDSPYFQDILQMAKEMRSQGIE